MKSTSQEFGVPDVEILYTNMERRVALLETKTIEVQAMLSAMRSGRPLPAAAAVAPSPSSEAGAENIPAFKPLTPAGSRPAATWSCGSS